MYLENENIRDLAGLQAQVTVMVSYGIISLSKKLTHNCFSQLRSINECLVIDWGGHDRWLGSADGYRWALMSSPKAAH